MALTRRTPQSILREEVIEERISEMMSRIRDMAVSEPETAGVSGPVKQLRTPDFSHLVREDLRAYFEDEIILAVPEANQGSIDLIELDHEVAKKALVGLKVSRLREGAEEMGISLPASQTSEEVATAVASALQWDSEAVARFVLDHEEEPSEGNAAHASRIYPLVADVGHTIESVRGAIQGLTGRYIRVGVARWFVFNDIVETSAAVTVHGTYMWYMADVDATKNHASLRSIPRSDSVAASILPSKNLIEASNVGAQAAKATVFALTAALAQPKLGYIPNAGSEADRIDGTVHGTVEFLLSILQDRLPRLGVVSLNPTVARFKYDKEETSTDDSIPRLKAVRFEGTHILDSVPACQLIASEGRPLAAVSFRMVLSVRNGDGSSGRSSFPVKISLEGDHVHIATGLGGDPVNARKAYEVVRSAVMSEIASGRPEDSSLDELVKRIKDRANDDGFDGKADIFTPAQGGGEGS